MSLRILIYALVFSITNVFAQDYFWTGNANSVDFFDENNWIDLSTGLTPQTGTIEPNQDINFNLNLTCDVIANAPIKFGNGSLSIENGSLNAINIVDGTIKMKENGYLELSDNSPLNNNTLIDFLNPLSWIKCPSINPTTFANSHLSQISINQAA